MIHSQYPPVVLHVMPDKASLSPPLATVIVNKACGCE